MKKVLAEEKGELDTVETLLAMVRGSVGAHTYRHLFVRTNGRTVDVLRDGDLSCAVFVSNVLLALGLIHEPHSFVIKTVLDMEASGWKKIVRPRIGAVVVWASTLGESGEQHPHIGFYIGNKKAISNSDKKRSPQEHHWTFGTRKGKPKRAVTGIYWHPRLSR